MSIQSIEIFFIILDPFTRFILDGIFLQYREECQVSIKSLNVERVGVERSRCLVKKAQEDSILLDLELHVGPCIAKMCTCEFYVDYVLLLSIGQFMVSSPILGLIPAASVSPLNMALPFSVIFAAPALRLSVPFCPDCSDSILKIALGMQLQISESRFHVNTYDLSVRFQEKNLNYPPMMENVTLTFTMGIQHDRKLAFKSHISDTNVSISLMDVTGFQQIFEQLSKTLDSFLSVRVETAGVGAVEVARVQFNSGKLRVTFCRDNRSSQYPVPFAQLLLPPITLPSLQKLALGRTR